MKYVYVVMSGCRGDEGIVAIYSNKKKAENKVAEINSTTFGRSTTPWVEKWVVE